MANLLDFYDPDIISLYEPLWAPHPSANAFYSAIGQSFKLARHYALTSVKFRMAKLGSPSGCLKAVLYAHTGTFGSGNVTGSALAISEIKDISQLVVYPNTALTEFIFVGDNQYILETAVPYVITIQTLSDTVVSYLNSGRATATINLSTTHEGNAVFYYNSSWIGTSSEDFCFYLYGNSVPRTGYIEYLKPLALSGHEGVNEEYLKAESDNGVLTTS